MWFSCGCTGLGASGDLSSRQQPPPPQLHPTTDALPDSSSPGGYGFTTRSQKTLRTGHNKAVLRAGLSRDRVLPPQVRSDSAQRGKCSFCYPTGQVSEFHIFLKMALVGLKGIAQIHFSMKTSFSQKKKKKSLLGLGQYRTLLSRVGCGEIKREGTDTEQAGQESRGRTGRG